VLEVRLATRFLSKKLCLIILQIPKKLPERNYRSGVFLDQKDKRKDYVKIFFVTMAAQVISNGQKITP
jgi:hypothetical protein